MGAVHVGLCAQAHDELSGVPGMWGAPLVVAAVYLVLYTANACYEDLYGAGRK